MVTWQDIRSKHPRSLLAGAMCLVLGGSVGLAAWLARARSAGTLRGVAVIDTIQARRLPAFWSPRPQSDWTLWRGPSGEPVGWFHVTRTRTSSGFAGRRIGRLGQGLFEEEWSLRHDAAFGRYSASAYALIRRGRARVPVRRRLSSTLILLRNGQIEVQREHLGRGRQGSAPAPRNYIPEGASYLAYRLTAAGGRDAQFRMVLNDEALDGQGMLHFARADVTILAPRRVRVRVHSPDDRGGVTEEVLEFDADGELVTRSNPATGRVGRRVPYRVVREAFPEVEAFAEEEAGAMPPGDEPETAPTGDGRDAGSTTPLPRRFPGPDGRYVTARAARSASRRPGG